jgi:hypothetical protein
MIFILVKNKDMKKIILYILVLIIASCSPKESPVSPEIEYNIPPKVYFRYREYYDPWSNSPFRYSDPFYYNRPYLHYEYPRRYYQVPKHKYYPNRKKVYKDKK